MSEGERILRQVCENTPQAMGLLGRDLIVREMSPAAEFLFGRNGSDTLPWPMDRLVDARSAGDLGREVRSLLAPAHDGRPGTTLELTATRRDGRDFQIEVALCPVFDGDARWILATFEDLSESRRLMAQASLAHRLDSVGHLAAGIAHEINTPIQYVGDNTQFLSHAFGELTRALDELPEGGHRDSKQLEDLEFFRTEVPEAVEQSLEGVRRVREIVAAMRIFSHPDSHEIGEVDLAQTVRSAITVARNEWKYVANVQLDLDSSLPLVAGNQAELSQVLLNLVVNAAQAIQDEAGDSGCKGTITIQTRRRGRWAQIRVADTGCGIPRWAQVRVFDPFFTTKSVGRGTGQGLAISHAVVARLGGSIHFDSEAGRGTTFTVRLPLRSIDGRLARTVQ
jgi:PAS domain S-box-containing protein